MHIIREVTGLESESWVNLLRIRDGVERKGPRTVEAEATELFDALREMSGATGGSVVVTTRLKSTVAADPLQGWRIPWVFVPTMPRLSEAFCRGAKGLSWTKKEAAAFEGAGEHRVGFHRRYADFTEAVDWTHVAFARLLGVRFRLGCVCSVSPDVEVYFLPSRGTDEPFTAVDANLALAAMFAWEPIVRRWTRRLGILEGGRILTPRERSVLLALLRGASEKESAVQLGLRPKYVHQVVARLYRAFSVSSRAELLSLCLGASDTPALDWTGRLFDAGAILLDDGVKLPSTQISMACPAGEVRPRTDPAVEEVEIVTNTAPTRPAPRSGSTTV